MMLLQLTSYTYLTEFLLHAELCQSLYTQYEKMEGRRIILKIKEEQNLQCPYKLSY
jgi:hypothetical protein